MDALDRHLRESQSKLPQDRMLQSRALAMNAALSSHTESSDTVKGMLERCVELRKDLLKTSSDYREANAKAHWKLAAFNDQMFTYHQEQYAENKKQQEWLKQTEQEKRKRTLHNESLILLRQKYADIQEQRGDYLKAALKHYMHCIKLDKGEGRFIGSIFRILHLWLDSSLQGSGEVGDEEKRLQAEVSELLEEHFEETDDLSVFTGVARQVLSRLDDKADDQAQKPMRVLLAKLLRQRPQELLLPTFYVGTLDGKKKRAKALIDDLRRDGRFTELVERTNELKEAYVELAKSKWCKAQGHAPCGQKDSVKCKTLQAAPPTTCDLKKFTQTNSNSRLSQFRASRNAIVRVPTAQPSDDEHYVERFGPSASYPGGVTCPKKITCHATTGREFTQIVKSEDPRGDVVLSQIFALVNAHLERDTKCRQRELQLATYAVVALGDKSCVLEFVDNATSLSSILGASTNKATFAKGLHNRYGAPDDWDYQKCSKAIDSSYKTEHGTTPEVQLRTYRKVCENCSPVFRHYFAESTRSARQWFALRLTYTRSVAVSSMAGHIVGLGDRHCSNILIRESGAKGQRGSVVHIDLGLIFDQARHLPRPENIPFRLTRDMVDGMGLAGTDGVMSRCAQESLRVMRENKHALLAIVDVLLHDPLECWKMSDQKREEKTHAAGGDDSSVSINLDALLIRKTIKDKLEGLVRGELLGVQGQVKQLISEAKAPENLSLLFQGWGAWY